jgi:hypothetical protein
MHHGKEPVSMMMDIYLILHLLSLPKEYLHLFLSSTNIYFLPVINIDAYKYNTLNYKDNQYSSVRKNRRVHKNVTCSINNIGVDLNRNYDFFLVIRMMVHQEVHAEKIIEVNIHFQSLKLIILKILLIPILILK